MNFSIAVQSIFEEAMRDGDRPVLEEPSKYPEVVSSNYCEDALAKLAGTAAQLKNSLTALVFEVSRMLK